MLSAQKTPPSFVCQNVDRPSSIYFLKTIKKQNRHFCFSTGMKKELDRDWVQVRNQIGSRKVGGVVKNILAGSQIACLFLETYAC